MRIDFGAVASYVATLKLPQRLLDELTVSSGLSVELEVDEGGGKKLRVGGEEFAINAVAESGECEIARLVTQGRASAPQLQSLGVVQERLMVQQRLGGAERAQIKNRTEQARKEAKEKHAIGLLSSSEASEPASKRVKRTVTPVPKPAPKNKPAPQPAAKPPPQPAAKPPPQPAAKPPPQPAAKAAARRPAARVSPADSAKSEAARVQSAPSEKEVANWCLHLLALGPRSLGDLHKAMRTAQQQQQLSGVALDTAFLKQILAQVAELKGSDRYHLRPEKLHEAGEGWAHYTAAQRSTLRAVRAQASGAVASARGGSAATCGASASAAEAPAAKANASAENGNRAPPARGEHANGVDTGAKPARSTNGVAELPRITSEEEYKRQKAVFSDKYKKYKQLDEELAAHTEHFEQLKWEYDRAVPPQRSVFAKQIETDYSDRSKEMTRQTEEYRALHVELKAIKAAVQRFVSET